jgi:YD repeat-containing protein
MTEVTSPLGAVTTFAYTPSTAFDNTGGDAPDLPQTLPLVTTVSVDDANGTVQTTTLDYEGGVFDPAERELRGFRRVTATRSADDRTTTTLYHQDAARAGLVESVEIRDGQGLLFARTESTYTPDADGLAPYTSLLASRARLEYDGQTEPRRSLTTYTYDGGGPLTLGNLTASTEYGEVSAAGAASIPPTRTTELSTRSRRSRASHSRTRRPRRRERVRAGASPGRGGAARVTPLLRRRPRRRCAPSLGDLTQRVDVLGDQLSDPTTRFAYDPYGNPVEIESPRRVEGEISGVATIEYDALYHGFPTALVNELGHRSELSYATPAECVKAHSAGAGLLHEAWDPNGLAAGAGALRCYDAFGRLVRDRAPANLAETTYVYVDTPGAATVTRNDRANGTGGVRASTVYLDGLGRQVATSSAGPQNQTVETPATYDAAGRRESESAPRFASSPDPLQITSYAYDVLDRPVETTLPGLRPGPQPRPRSRDSHHDRCGHRRPLQRRSFGRVLAVERSGFRFPRHSCIYDALGSSRR